MNEARSVTQTARAQVILREQILEGKLPAGMRLLEVPLAEKLQISRTPIRAALARLAEEGLLERVQGGGFVVRTFSYEDVVDAIELRGVLEGTAARLAAERGVELENLEKIGLVVKELGHAFETGAGAIDFDIYSELNAKFHRMLWGLAGSDVLQRELERAVSLPFASPSAFLHHRTRDDGFARSLVSAQEQHCAILEAITARESARAEAIAREHARIARRNLEHTMEIDRSLIGRVPGLSLVVS